MKSGGESATCGGTTAKHLSITAKYLHNLK
jgi:hypothetical protein